MLVVDDDVMGRMTAAQCLKKQGHTVDVAEGGAKALELLRSRHFDLVLLDLVMPEVDGFEVLRQMKADAELRQIPVLVVSGSDEAESIARCMEMGAAGHLSKPLDTAALAAEINSGVDKDG